jgi:hypothetical protein
MVRGLGIVLAVTALAVTACHSDRGAVKVGHQLAGVSSARVRINGPHVGEHVYAMEPRLTNAGKVPITILSVHVAHMPSGLREVSQATYRDPDGAGNTFIGWTPVDSQRYNPRHLSPTPIAGRTLMPGADFGAARQMMGEFVVRRPGTYQADDVVVIYRTPNGQRYKETLPWAVRVVDAGPAVGVTP